MSENTTSVTTGQQSASLHTRSIGLVALGLTIVLCAAAWLLTTNPFTESQAKDDVRVVSSPVVSAAPVELLGTLQIPGDARDRSGLVDLLEGNVPHDQLGGFSAIAYSGKGNTYALLPDRGPADGAVPYQCRIQTANIQVQPGQEPVLSFELTGTHLLKEEQGRSFNGFANDIDARNPGHSLRFDPEGVRIGGDGTIYICDEYGPHLFGFSGQGKLIRRYELPEHIQAKRLAPSKEEEHAANTRGRQTNRGFEGLAQSVDGSKLYPILQGPLLQDQPFDNDGERLGQNVRFLEFDIATKATREFVYVLDDPKNGISEVLRFDDTRFLVLERDSKEGAKAKFKRLYLADLKGASDVSRLDSLPAHGLPEGLQAMSKTLFLDLLDSRFGLPAELIPAKVEGMAFGPDLPDGRRLLLVCTDNDFVATEPSILYAFAVSRDKQPADGNEVADLGATPRALLATGPIPNAPDVRPVDSLTLRRDRSLYDGDPPRNADGTVNLIVEIPAGTNAKWEVTKQGLMTWEVREGSPRIVQFLPYPGNYGMIPGTLLPKEQGGDGDALDMLVLGPAVPRGSVCRVHVIGMMKFLDKGEQDDKILAVMENTPFGQVRNLAELNRSFPGAAEIVKQWFESYKGPGKMEFQGWEEALEANELINRAIRAASSATSPGVTASRTGGQD
ncbi:MAG: esterase-like activity of phytase family protein [Planctomycetaceae bacterium]|nr:esterase-like activity of phytase family protein [Planctomycetaceae bacterium]